MYARYKKELIDKENAKQSAITKFVREHNEDHADIERTVASCWDEVAAQMKLHDEQHSKLTIHNQLAPGGWRRVRLFVSSTFTDFFNEREILVKKVFPELQEWCSERRLKLIEVDLRWGIPSDATTGETIATCMEELDNCHQTNEGQPFFLNLIGERYGWIPDKSEVPSDVWKKYSWLSGTSITFMEIMHGALRSRNQNAAFFFRNSSFLSDIPADYKKRFQDADPLSQEHLHVLKSKIKEIFPANTFHYRPTFDGVVSTTGRDMVKIIDLDDFAEKCLKFFKEAIERKYPDQQNIASFNETDQEKELQIIFIKERSDLVIDRNDELRVIMNYVTGNDTAGFEKIAGSETTMREKGQLWKLSDDDNLVCVVQAQSGCGKTSFLSYFVVEATTKMPNLFFHFCGSTTRSYNEHELLKRMIIFLSEGLTVSEEEMKLLDGCSEEQISLLNKVLVKFRQSSRSAVIVVDAVNELNTNKDIDHLAWVPPSIPKHLHIIVSCNEHSMTLESLREHTAYWFQLDPLKSDSLKNIAVTYLGKFNKRLDDQQMSSLMSRSQVDSPLWMTLMCEELRVFGDFRMINRKIEEMPNSLDGLYGMILLRLQQEDNTGCIKKALCSLAASEAGILSADILKILGDIKNKELAPALYWAQARRHLKPYIRVMGFPEEYITFVHSSICKAVKKILLSTQEDNVTWQHHLADYYQYWCDHPYLKINYLPLHLKKAKENTRLAEFLQTDGDSMKIPGFKRSKYFDDLRCIRLADSVVPMTIEARICQVCRRKMRAFNPHNMNPAENTCIICTAFCFAFGNCSVGRICSFHSPKYTNKCFICGMFGMDTISNTVSGKLCNNCSFGHNKNKCVIIGTF